MISFQDQINNTDENVHTSKNGKGKQKQKVKSALRRRNILIKKKKASQKPSDIKKYKDGKATAQRIQRKAYWEYVNNIFEFGDPEKDENPGKQKRLWSYIKSLRNDTSGVSPLKENDKMHADPKDKADILNRQQWRLRQDKTQKIDDSCWPMV